MSGFQIKLTVAGRAALVNAQNTGTLPVTVTQIGVTASAFVPDADMLALPGELKRLATFAGAAVAADTIHVMIRDDSADTYSMRGFGLYLQDGTLFAVYGQADVILEKSAAAMMLLAADVIFADIDAASIAFGNTDFLNPPATTEVQGVVELATDAEANTGLDGVRAITAKALKYVLDQRFGVGAPSAFVKSLLSLATAALIRTALELKSAALKDEGANNGLDADLLDGQHGAYYLAWGNLTGKPATFAPSAHAHAWADLADPPATATRWPAWTEVTGKPATFAPAAHIHAAADITSGTFDVARIPALPTSQITGLDTALAAKAPLANPALTGTPTAPTAVAGTNTTQIATTAFVRANDDPAKANLASPTFTGTPTAPTAAAGTNTTQIATTAFVTAGLAGKAGTGHTHATLTRGSYLTGSNYNGGAATTWAVDATETDTASKIVARNASGDAFARLWRSTFADQTTVGGAMAFRINNTTDNYIRFCSNEAAIRAWLGAAPIASPTFTGTVTAPIFNATSSRRYKRSIETITAENALELLTSVRLVSYRLRQDGSYQMGVIAEELADGPLDFAVARTENGDPEAVNYQPLFILACAALQGMADRVAALESRG